VPTGFIVGKDVIVPGIPEGQAALFRARVWDESTGSYEASVEQRKFHGEYSTVDGTGAMSVILAPYPPVFMDPFTGPETDQFLPLTLTNIPELPPLFIGLLGITLFFTRSLRPAGLP
jgi:hypothetical protein